LELNRCLPGEDTSESLALASNPVTLRDIVNKLAGSSSVDEEGGATAYKKYQEWKSNSIEKFQTREGIFVSVPSQIV